jgi:FkbM family methyltransferase
LIMFLKKRIFQYIRSFGFFNGIALFFKVRRSRENDTVSFFIPGLIHEVFLRRHSSDFMVFEEIFIDQQYKASYPNEVIRTVIDAGSNIGLSALYFLRKYPSAKIICLEPEDANFELLKKNLSCYPNVILLKKGLWHSSQHLNIVNTQADSWGFEVKAAAEGDGLIEGISINKIITEYAISAIDLLKIDIEGSEKEVFEHHTAWIDKVNHLIVEVHENIRPGAYKAVTDLTSARGFRCVRHTSQYFFSRENQQNA